MHRLRHSQIGLCARTGESEIMAAVVAEGDRRKLYLPPIKEHIQTALSAKPKWRPGQAIKNTQKVSSLGYGTGYWHQLFTERQLTALNIFSELLSEVRDKLKGLVENRYADAVYTYLALLLVELLRAVAVSRGGKTRVKKCLQSLLVKPSR